MRMTRRSSSVFRGVLFALLGTFQSTYDTAGLFGDLTDAQLREDPGWERSTTRLRKSAGISISKKAAASRLSTSGPLIFAEARPHQRSQPNDPLRMFRCDACQIGLTRLKDDVQFLIQKERAWTKKDLFKRIDMLCQDPAMNEQYGRAQCADFLKDRRMDIARKIRDIQNPDSDYFEESLPSPKETCVEWNECIPGQKTLNEVLNEMPEAQPGEQSR
ncbi:unnamed protein product [Amoebophrya sp. A25]|nr:unnamed protein product [Amoebophrya sp. A25]|eukprot:GSA25T00026777001.1